MAKTLNINTKAGISRTTKANQKGRAKDKAKAKARAKNRDQSKAEQNGQEKTTTTALAPMAKGRESGTSTTIGSNKALSRFDARQHLHRLVLDHKF